MANQSFFGLSPQETALALEQERMQQLPQNKPYFAGDINFAVANQNLRELGPRVRAAIQERSFKPLIEGGMGGFRDPRMQRALLLDEARQEVANSGVSLDANPIDYYNSAFTSLMKRGLVDEANQVRTQALAEMEALRPTATQQTDAYKVAGGVIYNPQTGEYRPLPPDQGSTKSDYQLLQFPDGSVIEVKKGSQESTDALARGAIPYSKPTKEDKGEIRVIDGTAYRIDPKTGTGTPIKIDGKEMGAEKDKGLQIFKKTLTQGVIDNVKKARTLVSENTVGWAGLLRNAPETQARNLSNRLDTIKANLGFDRLQMMRDMSPTGGALGQVAVKELEFLQAAVANLDQLTTVPDLLDQLDVIETHYNNWLATLGEGAPNSAPGQTRPSRDLAKVPPNVDPELWNSMDDDLKMQYLRAGRPTKKKKGTK